MPPTALLFLAACWLLGCADALPLPEDDHVTTDENRAIDIDVLKNDRGATALGVHGLKKPDHGRVTLQHAENLFVYEPDPFFHGQDTFEYSAGNAHGSRTATVTIEVRADSALLSEPAVLIHRLPERRVDRLKTADFDGDRRVDLAVQDDEAGITVLLNRSEEPGSAVTFEGERFDAGTEPSLGNIPGYEIGDLDRDQKPDIVFGVPSESGAPLVVLFNRTKSGTRRPELVLHMLPFTGASVPYLAMGDLDHDGHADLALGTESAHIGPPVYFGRDGRDVGDLGPFDSTRFDLPMHPHQQVLAGDVTGDSRDELIVFGNYAPVGIFSNSQTGNRQFELQQRRAADPPLAWEATLADMNGDDLQDWMARTPEGLEGLHSTPDGGALEQAWKHHGDFDAFAVGDINDDGQLDVVTARPGGIEVWANRGQATADVRLERLGGFRLPFSDISSLAVADLDEDGRGDVVACESGPGARIAVLSGRP